MNGKIAVLLLVLCIGYVAADGAKPDYWYGKGKWYGPSRPWNPVRPWPVWNPLQLIDDTVVTSIPAAAPIAAGDDAVYWATVRCPANGIGSDPVGSCSWTGSYLAPVLLGSGAGLVDWTLVCVLDRSCGDYGVGSIVGIGRGEGTTGSGPVDFAIVGGTGAYAGFSKGGVIEARAGASGIYTYTFRFIR